MKKAENTPDIPLPTYPASPDVESASRSPETETVVKRPVPLWVSKLNNIQWPDIWFFRTYRRRWITLELSFLLIVFIITVIVMGALGRLGRPQKPERVCARWVRGKNMTYRVADMTENALYCTHWVDECTRIAGPVSSNDTDKATKDLFWSIPQSSSCIDWANKPTPIPRDPITGNSHANCVYWEGGGSSFDVENEPKAEDGKFFTPPNMSCVRWNVIGTLGSSLSTAGSTLLGSLATPTLASTPAVTGV